MIWVVVIIIVLLAGIIFLTSQISAKKRTGEQFLKSLEKFLEGKLQPMEGQPGAFKIDFVFQGQPFVYEDLPDRGFGEEVRKAYLKTVTGTDFSLYFTEKPRSTTIKTDVLIASNIPDEPIEEGRRVVVPSALKGLNVHTNDPQRANRFFANEKLAAVFLAFRNVDSRGYPSVALKITDGTVILEFHSAEWKIPNYRVLVYNLPSIEDHLEELMKIVRAVKGQAP